METQNFADYLRRFDYDERVAMKIQLAEMLKLYAQDKAQLVDIRFHEEHAARRARRRATLPFDRRYHTSQIHC